MQEHQHQLKRPPADTPPLLAQDGKGQRATVYAHYFIGNCDWFVTEYDPTEDRAFGWACLGDRQNAELGYMSIAEMEEVIVGPGFRVDHDDDWQPVTLAEAIARLDGKPTEEYRVDVLAIGETHWVSNLLRFATEAEALTYAKALYMRWTQAAKMRVVPADSTPNHEAYVVGSEHPHWR
jgi:hypothetical protein